MLAYSYHKNKKNKQREGWNWALKSFLTTYLLFLNLSFSKSMFFRPYLGITEKIEFWSQAVSKGIL